MLGTTSAHYLTAIVTDAHGATGCPICRAQAVTRKTRTLQVGSHGTQVLSDSERSGTERSAKEHLIDRSRCCE